MKAQLKKLNKMIAACVMAIVACGGAFADKIPAGETVDGVYHPDWKTLVETNEAVPQNTVIPAGETWIAYEEDMAWIRKIGYINREAMFKFQVRGTLIMEDTTTWFKGYTVDSENATYIKRGTTTVKASATEFNAGGTLIVEEGTVQWNTQEALGTADDSRGLSRKGMIDVRDGATVDFNFEGAKGLGTRTIKIAGEGADGTGVLICTYRLTVPFGGLVLEDDARIADNGSTQFLGGTVDLAGHTLTVSGTHATIPLADMTFANPGALVFKTREGGSRDIVVSGTTALSAGLTVTMEDKTRLLFDQAAASVGSDLVVSSGLVTVTSKDTSDIVLNGVISGAGNVSFGDAQYKGKGSLTLGQANAWTGTTAVEGNSAFHLKLKYGASIPDYSKLTIIGGKVVPMPGHDAAGLRWTADQLLSFSSAYQVTASARTITYDTTELTGMPALTIGSAKVAEYFPNLDVIWNASGTGSGNYTLTGPYTAEKPLDINLTGGSIRLSGNDQINLDDVLVSGTSETQGGTLLLDGAKDVVFGEKPVIVGAASASSVIGRLVVTNSVLRSTCTEQITANWSQAKGHLWVGSRAKGVLEIEEGGVISNKVYTGGGGPGSASGDYAGAVYQHGGIFAPLGNNQSYVSTTLGLYGYGFYQMDGGIVRPWNPLGKADSGWFALGGYSGATFIQNGGTVDVSGLGALTLGANGGGYAEYIVRKGTTTVPQLIVGMANGQGHGYLTVDGAEAEFITADGMYLNNYLTNPLTTEKHTIININHGGTLETKNFNTVSDNANYTSPYPVIVNFNGGVLRSAAIWNAAFAAGETKHVGKIAVYEDGLTIEIPQYGPTTQYTPIVAAGEGGIQSISLDAPVEGLIAPNVTITGDGYGATAIAEFDTRTRTVTNILITSRGWGYTAENTTVKLREGKADYQTLAFTVGTTPAGGLTKTGAGALNLYNRNTWAQWTKVFGGTLKVVEEGAIPDGTALTISNGATIDFNDLAEPTFTAIGGTGGTAANGSVKVVGESGVLSVSAQKFIDRESTAIAGTLDLSAVTEIALTDADVLTEEAKSLKGLNLITATTIVLPTGDVSITGVPKGWHARLTDRGLRLAPDKGMLMLLR